MARVRLEREREREREREERELGMTFGPFRDKLSSKDQIGQF